MPVLRVQVGGYEPSRPSKPLSHADKLQMEVYRDHPDRPDRFHCPAQTTAPNLAHLLQPSMFPLIAFSLHVLSSMALSPKTAFGRFRKSRSTFVPMV